MGSRTAFPTVKCNLGTEKLLSGYTNKYVEYEKDPATSPDAPYLVGGQHFHLLVSKDPKLSVKATAGTSAWERAEEFEYLGDTFRAVYFQTFSYEWFKSLTYDVPKLYCESQPVGTYNFIRRVQARWFG